MEGAEIIGIEKDSLAEELNLMAGDKILKVNYKKIKDLIQFQMEWAGEEVILEVKKNNGDNELYEIEKEYDEPLGAIFDKAIFDGLKTCGNKCIFCFVDQMPQHMRKGLYIKDDDYRLSFLQGSYITLTNLKGRDISRIKREHLSPLYVSVHATNPKIRKSIINNPRAGDVLKIMKELSDAGIKFHTQIVACPGVNDGEVLEETYRDLSSIEGVLSIVIVPVGLTRYRNDLPDLSIYTREDAQCLVKLVEEKQQLELQRRGSHYIWPSDEFYLLAGMQIPTAEVYEDYCQLENGVGMIRLLWDDFQNLQLPAEINPSKEIIIATGVSGFKVINSVVDRLNKIKGLKIIVKEIKNSFFGSTITVTGLLTGKCLLNGLKDVEKGSIVCISETMIKSGNGKFLDDLTPADVGTRLGINLITVPVDAKEILKKIIEV
ncbi:MAG: DUF512 domain-containing protein [Clostridia bacterium]|nr:DUF512 domain-containing protein [Clostridia bacterium]MDD4048211.1 DUF512 domain-containing protein [Clostridia bacterium]